MPAPRLSLARLSNPPDTSQLERCSGHETAQAISSMAARLHTRRAVFAARGVRGSALERILAGLQRLRNPALGAYRTQSGVVLCESFGARPSVVARPPFEETRDLVGRLLGRPPPRVLVEALANFGARALRGAVEAGVRAAIVPAGRAFSQCSRSVAALVPDIDRWAAPPAGLFVLEERLLLLRPNALRMAAAHEFAHALDAVLAAKPRSYFSFESPHVRAAFVSATGFVNEYAASGLDEYFAECTRAYVEVNDDRSSWPPLTRCDLHLRDPQMYAIIEGLFSCGFRGSSGPVT